MRYEESKWARTKSTCDWMVLKPSTLGRVAKGDEPGQPGASNMRELVWDEELEKIAQRFDSSSIIIFL